MKIDLNTSLKNNIHENSLTKTMKTYLVKVLQTYEETYLIETESEKKAVHLSVSDKLKPEKTKLIKSDITEVKKL